MEYPHLILVTIRENNRKEETIATFYPYTYLLLLNLLEYNKKVYLQRFENSLDFVLIGISSADFSALRLEIEAIPFKYNFPLFILSRSLLISEDGKEIENTRELLELIKQHPEVINLYRIGSSILEPSSNYFI